MGGDEFVVVCTDLASDLEAGLVAERIRGVIRTPLALEGEHLVITGSIGIAIAAAQQTERADAGSLPRSADAAMYRAKERGRDRWEVFDAAMVEQARARVRLAEELREVTEAGRFLAFYQPIVELRTGRIVGAEAPLRWRHPERGLLMPEAFLDVAESSGLIVAIGDWIVGDALDRLATWHATVGRELWVSVNVSGRQLGDRGMRQTLARRLDGSELGEFLRLELTESSLIENSPGVDSELAAAVGMGVRIGMDDFGTGYSSMTDLQRFPISFLKIDRRFLADLRPGIPAKVRGSSRTLLSAIIELTRTLGIDAIAEGIETADQAAALVELGCQYGQGYHFGAPADADSFGRPAAT